MAQYKINLSFPPAVVARMDEYCRQNNLTRSGFVTMAVDSYLTAHSLTDALKELTKSVQKLVEEKGTEEDIEKICKASELLDLINSRDV